MAAPGCEGRGTRVRSLYSCEHWEIVKPSVSELTREVRNNILCTVTGCGKVLPNPPALNMHLVKSHRIQDGEINPTLRKDLKASQKLYCCPIEGCPRGTNRPFSQFSRVKQHFMKMHAEKKHKCVQCGSCYGTEWDLKRHLGYCGKTFHCTCGCPYASRTALLSHVHRTGHEIPFEHREPPVKKRKIEAAMKSHETMNEARLPEHALSLASQDDQTTDLKLHTVESLSSSCFTESNPLQPKQTQTLLLPKLALLKLPVMQLTHLSVLVPSSACSVKPVLVTVDKDSVATSVQILSNYSGSIVSNLDTNAALSTGIVLCRNADSNTVGPVNSFVQVNLDKAVSSNIMSDISQKNRITSDVQTDISYFTQSVLPDPPWTSESCVSSCSQTDLSFNAQISLPINVETQTLQLNYELPYSTKTDVSISPCFSGGISRETQTHNASRGATLQVDQAVMCENLFDGSHSFYTVSTQTSKAESRFLPGVLDQSLLNTNDVQQIREETIGFVNQNGAFPNQNMTDNQTQTMELLSDLEKILSDNMPGQPLDNRGLLSVESSGGDANLSSNCTQNPGIDFDIDEFFSASNIQTQTEDCELGNLTSEYLDIETQTDFLFSEDSAQLYSNKANASILGMEMFDTQTQTDLNCFLDSSSHLPLGSILRQSSFSMSTDSSDTDSHANVSSESKTSVCHSIESQVQQNSAETQTTHSCSETLGHLFLTSNETQTAMDDFLLADLAWNTIDSQFSSVETQTCGELFSLFSSDKSQN
ncbi:ATM interactor [Xenopus laevis]|uniref:ATM interactor n=3 Tax=Xenopus laevis TaxID=8355 RepID=A0A1L8GKS5_XENLA|nr:ATM interactor [Xenopus laevis]OCT84413.1 hypothetical protein XELAEV_18022566mg [Xenopus laevis]